MRLRIAACLLAILATADLAPCRSPLFDPTTEYERERIAGFTVLMNRRVLAQPDLTSAVRAELGRQLLAVSRVLPSTRLADIQSVKVWVELDAKSNGAAEFHPSERWLRGHGYNPDKVGGVEVSNARNFLRWSQTDQPCMLLHELAHAYHFRVLGEGHAGIARAFKQAVDQRRYAEVEHVSGKKRRAYALTNEKEYFAELTEAYFGKNDFYPFVRSELQSHDPIGYKLLQEVWGKPQQVTP